MGDFNAFGNGLIGLLADSVIETQDFSRRYEARGAGKLFIELIYFPFGLGKVIYEKNQFRKQIKNAETL